jgi:hypothetical protein
MCSHSGPLKWQCEMEAERPLGQMGGESPLEDVPAASVKAFT